MRSRSAFTASRRAANEQIKCGTQARSDERQAKLPRLHAHVIEVLLGLDCLLPDIDQQFVARVGSFTVRNRSTGLDRLFFLVSKDFRQHSPLSRVSKMTATPRGPRSWVA